MIYYDCTNDVCMAHCFSCCTVESDLLIKGSEKHDWYKIFLVDTCYRILFLSYCVLFGQGPRNPDTYEKVKLPKAYSIQKNLIIGGAYVQINI